MSNNPDHNSQAFIESGAQTPDGRQGDSAGGTQQAAAADDLNSVLKKTQDEAAELKDAFLRAKAETENVRRQSQNDVSKAHRYAIERFAQDLLQVKDALEQSVATANASVETLRDGAVLTLKNLNAAFEKAQVSEIDPAGEKYDPHRHQAMTMVDSDQPPNTVVQVFQKGYLLNDRVLRPALVAVSKSKEQGANGS